MAGMSVVLTAALSLTAFAATDWKNMISHGTVKPWLFIDEEYANRNRFFTQAELDGTVKTLTDLSADLEAEGIKFVVLIAPDKEDIYPEYAPAGYSLDGGGRTEQLFNYLKTAAPQLNVVYPIDELKEAKAAHTAGADTIYYTSDSHWNEVGADVASRELIRKIAAVSGKEYEDFPGSFGEPKTRQGDLQVLLGLGSDWSYSTVSYPRTDSLGYVKAYELYNEENCDVVDVVTQNDSPVYDLKVYLTGDSYRENMVPTMGKYFSQFTAFNRFYFDTDFLLEDKPDVFVYECAGRYCGDLGMIAGYSTAPMMLPQQLKVNVDIRAERAAAKEAAAAEAAAQAAEQVIGTRYQG